MLKAKMKLQTERTLVTTIVILEGKGVGTTIRMDSVELSTA